eukprot:5593477-Pyramimonas_sp.AAC.1
MATSGHGAGLPAGLSCSTMYLYNDQGALSVHECPCEARVNMSDLPESRTRTLNYKRCFSSPSDSRTWTIAITMAAIWPTVLS